MKSKTWYCGDGHEFTYGDEEWHHEQNQGFDNGYPIPMYCNWGEDGEYCLDSSSLIPEF